MTRAEPSAWPPARLRVRGLRRGNERAAGNAGVRHPGARRTATLLAPYFEANRNWELIAGTDVVPSNSAYSASVTVINPVIMPYYNPQGALVKVPGAGGFRFERGSAFVYGGNFFQMPRPLVFTAQVDNVQAAAALYPHLPEREGGTLAQLPGTVLYKKPGTGQQVQAGNVIYGPNP